MLNGASLCYPPFDEASDDTWTSTVTAWEPVELQAQQEDYTYQCQIQVLG